MFHLNILFDDVMIMNTYWAWISKEMTSHLTQAASFSRNLLFCWERSLSLLGYTTSSFQGDSSCCSRGVPSGNLLTFYIILTQQGFSSYDVSTSTYWLEGRIISAGDWSYTYHSLKKLNVTNEWEYNQRLLLLLKFKSGKTTSLFISSRDDTQILQRFI